MAVHAPERILLGFARAVRASGVAVTPDRARAFLESVALVGLDDRLGTYWAGRATLCSSPEDLARFDHVFDAWFGRAECLPSSGPDAEADERAGPEAETGGNDEDDDGIEGDAARPAASELERLRHRDVAGLSAAERRRLDALFAGPAVRPPTRTTARHERWRRGSVDGPATLRRTFRNLGEPAPIARRRRRPRPRRVVLLVDVSGSMSAYADALLRFAHRISGGIPAGSVEVFTLGTRVTRISRAMRLHDADRAIVAAGDTVPDWSGGTRLGETLRAFLDRWGARGMARGAVVVVLSDGWERGDPALLRDQMARLHRLAHAVIWVNPHRGKDGYQPLQQGVQAVLPHVDHFLAGHSLATFSAVLDVVADA
jgi:uncharacterized protein with von Willebrand factor type A (vWA) domain